MDPQSLVVLLVMGALAGAINSAVGSGSLLTLPVLLALGLDPGTAVRTNTMGMAFSTVGSFLGYRREIREEWRDVRGLAVVVLICAAIGSCLLLVSPPGALQVVVPILIVVALVLVVFQKRLTSWIPRRTDGAGTGGTSAAAYRSAGLRISMGAASMYGGYFTAAQGILYLGLLGAFTGRSMKSLNAVKNLFGLLVNAVAALVYLVAHVAFGAEVRWEGIAAIAVGGLLGGYFGSRLTKGLPEWALRGTIVVVVLIALVRQFIG
ncbi:permease [Brachybacterium endophyticum]|uniref:Probable membrane transporter protein n=1 Tax=Brachybacterium endophyticum TaxID=2182385 RepID=A0A2U2RGX4_9MICO|nr:sulfite exporter TauE/SafE family protein [Brachybacterium endophyticum]PWH05104.1 permease [Brachybacterium endophyticum]